MSLKRYFDTRFGSVSIVEAEVPEEGFIEMTENQSKLALRYGLDNAGNPRVTARCLSIIH